MKWTDAAIMEALRSISKDGFFPAHSEFAAAGMLPLYSAIARRGGRQAWCRRAGLKFRQKIRAGKHTARRTVSLAPGCYWRLRQLADAIGVPITQAATIAIERLADSEDVPDVTPEQESALRLARIEHLKRLEASRRSDESASGVWSF